jgi:hypothetical protein
VFTCPDPATHVEGAQPMSDEDRAELDGRRVQTLRAPRVSTPTGLGPAGTPTKTEPSYDDMTIKLRRVIIAARFRRPCPEQASPQETRAVLAAWAAAGT